MKIDELESLIYEYKNSKYLIEKFTKILKDGIECNSLTLELIYKDHREQFSFKNKYSDNYNIEKILRFNLECHINNKRRIEQILKEWREKIEY